MQRPTGAGLTATLAHRAAHNCTVAESLGQHLGGLAVGRKASEDRILCVVNNDLRTLFAIIFLQLGKALDDRYQRELSGTSGTE